MSAFGITGASTNAGRACALHFAERGETIAAPARSSDRLAELREESPTLIHPYTTDVSDSAAVQSAFDQIVAVGAPMAR